MEQNQAFCPACGAPAGAPAAAPATPGRIARHGRLLGILAGAGLLARQPWARVLAIVLAFTLWVLLPAESGK